VGFELVGTHAAGPEAEQIGRAFAAVQKGCPVSAGGWWDGAGSQSRGKGMRRPYPRGDQVDPVV